MRELQFRLRDRHNKIVGYEKWYEGHWQADNDPRLSPNSGYWEAKPCWLYSEDGKLWAPAYIPHRYKDQYIGLKDKNGKEAYHYDLCKDEFNNLWRIDWSVEYAGFELTLIEAGDKMFGEIDKLNICRVIDTGVIGNIYENKGLLENKE